MSKGRNKWEGIGRLGRDPELKETSNGLQIAKFSMACPFSTKRDGEWQDDVEWVYCTIFGKPATVVAQYVGKGDQIFVEGRLSTSTYEKDGETKYSTGIIVNDFVLLSNKRKENNNAPVASTAAELGQDDIPF